MDVAVRLPPFKPPKVPAVEYEAPQLLPLPELLDEEVHCSSVNWRGLRGTCAPCRLGSVP